MINLERKRQPWEKDSVDLTKHDWLVAVGLSLHHKHSPLQLRVAIAIMQHADMETKIAWPSQQTLARYVGVASDSQVRRAIVALCASGAITRCRISQLPHEDQAKVSRNRRGVAYKLEMFWAYETLEESQKPLRAEPKQLRDGKRRHRATAERSNHDKGKSAHRTTAERNDRTTSERHAPHYDSATNKEGNNREQKEGAGNEEPRVESTREDKKPSPPLWAYELEGQQ